jgi:DNA-binding response OmpR family regulator
MKKNILIIDDDHELCEEMAEILRDEGYLVDTAFDSIRGEEMVKTKSQDIIILDFKLPGLNGVELLKIIKTTKPATAVFLVTGRPFIEKLLQDEKLEKAVAGVMNKPFDIQLLLDKIKTL